MFKAFIQSFRLKNAYRVNSLLYSFKSIPLLGRLLPQSLYTRGGLKTFATGVSALYELISVFLYRALYLGLMVVLPLLLLERDSSAGFLHILLFLTLIGATLNNTLFDATKDKYYAVFLLRMDARLHLLSSYFYTLGKAVLGFLLLGLIFGAVCGTPWWCCILLALYVPAVKGTAAAWMLRRQKAKWEGKARQWPKGVEMTVNGAKYLLLLAAAYLPPLLLNRPLPVWAFTVIAVLFLGLFLFSLGYILRFDQYRRFCKENLTEYQEIIFQDKDSASASMQRSYQEKLDTQANISSGKTGYAYFNDLFIKRHSRFLMRKAKRITLIAIALLGVVILFCFLIPEVREGVNGLMLNVLPYFLFVMYFINRGQEITQAMFINCDHSMLSYRFYRQPKVILNLFAARLRSIAKINLMPALVIATGLPLLLFLTGGTANPLNYLVLFVSILAMSVFFSVHTLVLYYLLQPYNINVEMKNPLYTVFHGLTYIVCYVAIGKEAPTLLFGTLVIVFCILYIAVALLLAYRLAPKTFRLRQ